MRLDALPHCCPMNNFQPKRFPTISSPCQRRSKTRPRGWRKSRPVARQRPLARALFNSTVASGRLGLVWLSRVRRRPAGRRLRRWSGFAPPRQPWQRRGAVRRLVSIGSCRHSCGQDVNVMGQPIEQRAGDPRRPKRIVRRRPPERTSMSTACVKFFLFREVAPFSQPSRAKRSSNVVVGGRAVIFAPPPWFRR